MPKSKSEIQPNPIEKAKNLAILKHDGQMRKSEPDLPLFIHLLGVYTILKDLHYSNDILTAGILHDILDHTDITLDFISETFGTEVAKIVTGCSEDYSITTWKSRKANFILKVKTLNQKTKVVLCAELINNLEELKISWDKLGYKDFSFFNANETMEIWYFQNMYRSLIYNEDENSPIFKRLKAALDAIVNYGKTEDDMTKETIFANNTSYYKLLKQINARILELRKLKEFCSTIKPFVIEFGGTPRCGKTKIANKLLILFAHYNFSVNLVDEYTTSKEYKRKLEQLSDETSEKITAMVFEEMYNKLLDAIALNSEIILLDRSITDRQIWREALTKPTTMLEFTYANYSKELIDYFVLLYALPETCMEREYNANLFLTKRTFLSVENLENFNKSLFKLKDILTRYMKKMLFVNTTNLTENETIVMIANALLISLRDNYVDMFLKEYSLDA